MIAKFRHLFISSFRWRILINISFSYLIAMLLSSIIEYLLDLFHLFDFNDTTTLVFNFVLAFFLFVAIFFMLMNLTLRYINTLNESIQEVTMGNYDVKCEIEYDDELGLLAANINALAQTLKENQKESEILKQNERLAYDAERNAEKQKNDLITNIAHDLRTPLTTIIGYLDLIQSNDLSQEDINNYAHIAYSKSLRLQSMMDDLFEFTKLDNTKVKIQLNVINISELIMQITDEFFVNFQEHGITPVLNIQDRNVTIIGDGQLLARVFENIISNALKYGYDHSELKIEVLSDNETVSIKIMNMGDTIDKNDIPYIFDKFYRADSARGTTQGGTGLGLAISKNIVKMHKGKILITSHHNITTFIVMLPRHIQFKETH